MIGETATRLWTEIVVRAAGSTPSPTPVTPSADSVTPGVWGFAITFLIGAATILLIIDMTRRVRRNRFKGEIAEKLDAEEAEQQHGSSSV